MPLQDRAAYRPTRSGTTCEGIRLGAMAGTLDLVQRCCTGMEVRGDVLCLEPRPPEELHELALRVRFGGFWLELRITHDRLEA